MKRLFVIFLGLLFFSSCSIDDNEANNGIEFTTDQIPVEAVDLPEEFKLGETYPLKISYFRPSTCYAFKEISSLQEDNQYTIFPVDYVFVEDNCEMLDGELIEKSFNFIVESDVTYIFRFWQGKDSEGVNQYMIFEIPVVK